MKKKNGFTLIELIAVLVILAILALIVTPLVMSIIRNTRISADKRSIDAYGRSIELAIAEYLLDTGSFPTSIEQLTIEYSGEEVVCETTQLSSDSSVYLAGCIVGGRSVAGYTYGKEEAVVYNAYEVGDEVTYNNVDYYVIKDSDSTEESVTLLKKTPLTVAEVNQYGGVGTENNHVNVNGSGTTEGACYHSSCDSSGYGYNGQNYYPLSSDGYGTMAYYTSTTCAYVNSELIEMGCKTDYDSSEIKYVVDAWAVANVPSGMQEARIIKYDDFEYMGYVWGDIDTSGSKGWVKTDDTPNWIYSNNFDIWTMTPAQDSFAAVLILNRDSGQFSARSVYESSYSYPNGAGVVRPVITIKKSVLSK